MEKIYGIQKVIELLDVKKSRLEHWINLKHIPAGKVVGHPRKRVFHITDIYAIALFQQTIDFGFTRKRAAYIVRTVNWNAVLSGKEDSIQRIAVENRGFWFDLQSIMTEIDAKLKEG
jgi:hypothetical protein